MILQPRFSVVTSVIRTRLLVRISLVQQTKSRFLESQIVRLINLIGVLPG